jgi:hypothetical protein
VTDLPSPPISQVWRIYAPLVVDTIVSFESRGANVPPKVKNCSRGAHSTQHSIKSARTANPHRLLAEATLWCPSAGGRGGWEIAPFIPDGGFQG